MRVDAAVGRGVAAHRRVEGREQGVLDEHPGARDAVEQARLARVRVPRDRDRRHGIALAIGALGLAGGLHADDLPAQPRHARVDATPVELDLRLTGTARAHAGACAADLATGLARHRLTPAAQAGQQVLELRELDLRLALTALGVLAEDVEDDRRAVDDLDLDRVFERTPLARGELGVGDDRVCAERGTMCRSSSTLPRPRYVLGSGCGRRWSMPSSTRAPAVSARAESSRMEFSASSSEPCEYTPMSTTFSSRNWRYSTSVTSSSSVESPATRRRPARVLTVVLLAVGLARCVVRAVVHQCVGCARPESGDPGLGLCAAQHPLDGVVCVGLFGIVHPVRHYFGSGQVRFARPLLVVR